MCHRRPGRGCQYGLRSAESRSSRVRNRASRNRSRPDQLSHGDSGCSDAARDPHSSLVSAATGGAGNLLLRRRLAPRAVAIACGIWCALPSGTTACSPRHWASNSGVRLPLPLPPGGCGGSLRCDLRLDDRPDPRWCSGSRSTGVLRQDLERLDRAHSLWRLGIHCPGDAVFGSPGRGVLLGRSLTATARPATPPARTTSGCCSKPCSASLISRAF
jgi:hypothetical protein